MSQILNCIIYLLCSVHCQDGLQTPLIQLEKLINLSDKYCSNIQQQLSCSLGIVSQRISSMAKGLMDELMDVIVPCLSGIILLNDSSFFLSTHKNKKKHCSVE